MSDKVVKLEIKNHKLLLRGYRGCVLYLSATSVSAWTRCETTIEWVNGTEMRKERNLIFISAFTTLPALLKNYVLSDFSHSSAIDRTLISVACLPHVYINRGSVSEQASTQQKSKPSKAKLVFSLMLCVRAGPSCMSSNAFFLCSLWIIIVAASEKEELFSSPLALLARRVNNLKRKELSSYQNILSLFHNSLC